MNGEKRREEIQKVLMQSLQPISATALAGKLSVSRQVIVGDIALLRTMGMKVLATPRGYLMLRENGGLIRQIACKHNVEIMRSELNVIVDQGCTVLDVIVEHPIYGQLTGSLQLSSRYDVDQFIRRCRESDALPLSHLTEGIHLHTLSCPSEEAFSRVRETLRELHILLSDL